VIEPFDDEGESKEAHAAPLANNVTDVSFRYYSDGAWFDAWENTARLPELVQIELDSGTTPFWPEFSVGLIYLD
jgi:hypothetical protein